MSYSLDVNILLYASDETNRWHKQAKEFVTRCISGPEIVYLAWPTIMSYLRMATHSGIFEKPLSQGEAENNIQNLFESPHVCPLAEEEGFWETYRKLTAERTVRGTLVPDAHLAAILLHHGVKILYTKDRDFEKFDLIEVRDPFPDPKSAKP